MRHCNLARGTFMMCKDGDSRDDERVSIYWAERNRATFWATPL